MITFFFPNLASPKMQLDMQRDLIKLSELYGCMILFCPKKKQKQIYIVTDHPESDESGLEAFVLLRSVHPFLEAAAYYVLACRRSGHLGLA